MNPEVADAPAGSSPATDSAADQSAQAAPGVTAAPTGAQAESTPTAADELAEFQADVAKATGEKPAGAESKTDAEKAEGASTDEPPEEKGGDQESDALSQDKSQDKNGEAPERLTDRPEWKAATAIADKVGPEAGKQMRGILRNLYKAQHTLNTQLEAVKPAQQVVQEMLQSVGGSQQGFDNMRNLIRLYDSDPDKAVPQLEMLLNDARQRAGLVLQSPDLKTEAERVSQALKDGVMDQTDADRRLQELTELEQARSGTKRQQQREESERQRQSREQAELKQSQAVKTLNETESNWVAEKTRSDPDFEAVQELQGKFTRLNVSEFAWENGRLPNVKEAVDLLEKSLKEAKAEAMKFKPRPRERQVVKGGEGSSGINRQQPMSEQEEFERDVEMAVQRHSR